MHGLAFPTLPQEVAEVLPEEDGRPPVREDEARVRYVRREIMGCDLFQEWIHGAKIGIGSAKVRHIEGFFLSKIHLFGRCCK
jgi:hypothetical protein